MVCTKREHHWETSGVYGECVLVNAFSLGEANAVHRTVALAHSTSFHTSPCHGDLVEEARTRLCCICDSMSVQVVSKHTNSRGITDRGAS